MSKKHVILGLALAVPLALGTCQLGRKAAAKRAAANAQQPPAGAAAGQTASAAEPVTFPENWIPSAAGAVLEIARPERLIELAANPAIAQQFRAQGGPLKRLFDGGPERRIRGVSQFLEKQVGADLGTTVRRITKGGVLIGVGEGKTWVAIAEADDAAFLAKLNDTIVGIANRSAKSAGRVVRELHGDVPCWTLSGGDAYHAIAGKHLILSNKLPALKMVLDLKASGGPSLADNAEFQAAKKLAGDDATATLFVASAVLQNLPKGGAGKNLQGNPMAVLLLAAYGDALSGSGWTALKADVGAGGVTFRLDGGGAPPRNSPVSFAWPEKAGDGALPNIAVPRQIAGISLYRDLRGFYASKDTLFPERTSQLIFFENMMGIYFSGRDITEDVMGSVGPHIRLIAAEQAYDAKIGTPSLKIPAFAVVFRMNDKARYGVVAEEAWQKLLGMINFTRGQKAQPGLIIDRVEHGGIRYTCAAFSDAEEPDRANLDSRFNFRPSIACVGDLLIFSTTDQLANDIIDAVRGAPPAPVAGVNSLAAIDGGRLAAVLEANKENMIRENMVKKGMNREEAEKDFANGMRIIRTLGTATLQAGAHGGRVSAQLAFDLGRAPAVSGPQAMAATHNAGK